MPPPITPRCRGARCGGAPPQTHGPLGPGGMFGRHFGRRPSAFGSFGIGNRPGAPFAPPPIVPPPVRPPGVPVTPPPLNYPPAGSPIHPPAPPNYPPPGYPPPGYPPPGYPPPGYPPPPSWPNTYPPDYPPIDPMAGAGYADPSWGYADDGSLPFDPSLLESGGPAWDLWQSLMTGYMDTRNAAASESGESFPETTVGDVRKASLVLSRELCLPRYDFANLAATRAAWRDALARIHGLCAGLAWAAPYPENERFWLSDSLALAQRLAAVDARRNSIAESPNGALLVVGDEADLLTTWQDVRAFFLARRIVNRDNQGHRYPETTVGDAHAVAQFISERIRDIIAPIPASAPAITFTRSYLREWRVIADAVRDHARRAPHDETYPNNAEFWRAARRVAIRVSAIEEATKGSAVSSAFIDRVGS